MSCAEHIIENAITAIANGKTYKEWIENEPNKGYVKSDPKEIWKMAMYVYTSSNWRKVIKEN